MAYTIIGSGAESRVRQMPEQLRMRMPMRLSKQLWVQALQPLLIFIIGNPLAKIALLTRNMSPHKTGTAKPIGLAVPHNSVYFIISENSLSSIIFIPSFTPLSSFDPAFSPASRMPVFLETLFETFPPIFSIISAASSRE